MKTAQPETKPHPMDPLIEALMALVKDASSDDATDALGIAFARVTKERFNVPGPSSDYGFIETTLTDAEMGVMKCRVCVFRETPPVDREKLNFPGVQPPMLGPSAQTRRDAMQTPGTPDSPKTSE